ncbi:uncharacterized protein LOC128635216 [Ictalurus punctatus]|uniref:Uncharacterized protein LOC128635216 n=1 Tax=Ictalurus punctatus TaxID=7998 RepID=A0A9F7RHC7_ICTPU|nr:uncharacterized protein LOC128635216 [Ictalurus punctatus]
MYHCLVFVLVCCCWPLLRYESRRTQDGNRSFSNCRTGTTWAASCRTFRQPEGPPRRGGTDATPASDWRTQRRNSTTQATAEEDKRARFRPYERGEYRSDKTDSVQARTRSPGGESHLRRTPARESPRLGNPASATSRLHRQSRLHKPRTHPLTTHSLHPCTNKPPFVNVLLPPVGLYAALPRANSSQCSLHLHLSLPPLPDNSVVI